MMCDVPQGSDANSIYMTQWHSIINTSSNEMVTAVHNYGVYKCGVNIQGGT